jgi:uncharacterized protein YaaN involved in tellurite resistance
MSEKHTAPAGESLTGLEEKPLPPAAGQPLPLARLDPERKAVVEQLVREIDISDHNSLLFFGSTLQRELTELSDTMLEGVRNKDVEPAADSLSQMVLTLRGFGAEDLARKPGLFARLFGTAKPVVKFLQQYETVRGQIDAVTDRLEEHKTQLLTDIVSLDRLYDSSLQYFRALENHIAAGEEKLRLLDTEEIPAAERAAAQEQAVVEAQLLRDLRSARDDLERRVHDLRLTRQVTMQALPSIRLVQENDKGLVRKIQSTMANTIPLWRQQLAQAITIFRSGQAADTVKAATDLTNELLEKNADALQTANRQVRTQIERGVFDVEVVQRANDKLIATIQESLQIAEEGKRKRAEAVHQLEACENELRRALSAAADMSKTA